MFSGTTPETIYGTSTFGNVTVASGSNVCLASGSNATITGNVTLTGTLTVGLGTLKLTGSSKTVWSWVTNDQQPWCPRHRRYHYTGVEQREFHK